MRLHTAGFTLLTIAAASSFTVASADPIASLPLGPVRTVTSEPGVIPPGTAFVVRTDDAVRTHRAYRGTVYAARVAEDILDQNGTVLIPKDSPVQLAVRSLGYLGPGGVGMWELTIDVRAVTVNGVMYPVETHKGIPSAGGLGLSGYTGQWLGGEVAGPVITSGRRINVPPDALLAFHIQDPIRLSGFRRN